MKPLFSPQKRVHIIGIGGIGTSALAQWFKHNGFLVNGSDTDDSFIIHKLKKQGIKVIIGHSAKNLKSGTELVIYSAAIPENNPELKKAKFLNIPIQSYAEALGGLTQKYKTIAVSGAHGKSTTTALLSLVLIRAGLDPTVIIGTKLKEFKNNNFRPGRSKYLVIEADEYKDSFLNHSPFAAIITNIDKEHLDYYKNLSEIKSAFLKFISNIQQKGILVLNQDDKNLLSLRAKIQKIVQKNKLQLYWYGIPVNPSLSQRVSVSLKIPGKHNVSNVLAVYTLTRVLKIKEKDIFEAISQYRGSWRRMEYRGQLKTKNSKLKAKVYDDYAHHPTEIKATLSGIAQKWPKTPVICVFQPHQAKRLQALFKDFVGAFDRANALILLPIYQVRGRDSSILSKTNNVSQNVNSEKLALVIKRHLKAKSSKLKAVVYLPHPKNLRHILKNILKTKSYNLKVIIVMMGAGDIYKLTNKLIQ